MSINAKPWEGAGGAATVPDASETTKGKIRIATSLEASTGTDDLTAMTPAKVKARIDAALVGGVEYKGDYTGQSLVTAKQGDLYVSNGDQTLAGVSLTNNDHIIFNQDAADPVTASMFDVIDNTETPASETVAGVIEIATNAEATAASATDKALVPSNISSIDLSQADNTTSGFISDITSESLNDLSDVSYTAGAGIDNYVLTYDHSTTSWGAEAAASGGNQITLIDIKTTSFTAVSNAVYEIQSSLTVTMPGSPSEGDLIGFYAQGTATPSLTVSGTIETINNVQTTSATIEVNKRNVVWWGYDGARWQQLNDSIKVATVSLAGVLETASNAEATAATATDKALTPSNIGFIDLSDADNTTSGFISDITSESLNDLSDVAYTAGAGIDNYVLTYDHSATSWGAEAVPSAASASETVAGVIEIATNAEAAAGTATDKALVPSNISSVDLSQADNTTSGFISGITGESLNDLSDVSYTAGAGIDNYVLTYDNSTTSWGAEVVPSASAASETVAGVIEIATNAEAAAGTATDKALVPSNISSVDLSQADNTTSGFISGITGESLDDLSDVSYTAGAGIDNYVLTYDHSTTSWGAEVVPSASAASETVAGVIEIATNAEAAAGTATDKALVPSNISSVDLSQADNTTSGFISGITGESLNDLSDVSYTAGAGIDNYVLTYDHSTTSWGAEAATGGGISSVSEDSEPTLGGDLKVAGYAITSASNGNVTINPDGTGDISIGADIIPDADATHTIGDEDNRFISLYSDVNGAIRFKAKNDQGSAITKGQVVYLKGVSGTVPTVGLARANSSSTMPAFGLALANANDQAEVQIITFGNLTDYNTTTYSLSANDTVFVSAATAGALTNSAPTGEANLIQNIGRVVRADASAGIIKVGGAGRSAATPNLDQDKVFLGNASNQAVSTALSAINLTSFNDDLGSTYQPLDTGLTSIAGLTTSANQMLYTTGSDAYDVTSITAAGRAILDDADAAAQRTTLGLVIGTDVLGEVADDSTPQLSGDLDTNGQDIITTSNADLDLAPDGTGVVAARGNTTGGNNTGAFKLYCQNNSHWVGFKSPVHDDYGTSIIWELPAGDGSPNQVLKTDGSGVLSWVDQSGGGGGGSAPAVTSASPSSDYTISTTTGIEEVFLLTPSADINVNLPAAATAGTGYRYHIKNLSGSYNLTIDPNSTETIDGVATFSTQSQNESITCVSNGSNWFII